MSTITDLSKSDSERLASIETTVDNIDKRLFGDDGAGGMEGRLRALENRLWWILGAAAVLAASGGLGGVIAKAIDK